MKILFFLSQFPKLSETFILNQIVGLLNEGHDITIIAKNKELKNKLHSDITKYQLLDKMIYYGFDENANKFKKGSSYLIALFRHYINKLCNKKYNGRVKFKDLIKHRDLLFLLKECNTRNMNFDVVYAHFGPNGILAQKLIKIGLIKGRLFTSFHGADMLKYVKQNGQDTYTELFNSNSTLLPISEYWKNKLVELGANPKNIIVHHMGIDVSKFEFNPLIPEEEIKILSVARFVEKKGLIYGISAIGQLIKKGYNIQYSIIGGGPLEQELKEFISNEQLANNIKILGWKTQEEVIKILKESHIILLPSITSDDGDMEGIPVILMEAMAMGKIVVSTYHSGIPELIHNNINGYLVRERDIEGLSNTIEEIISSRKHWGKITLEARGKITKEFNVYYLNQNLVKIFLGKQFVSQLYKVTN